MMTRLVIDSRLLGALAGAVLLATALTTPGQGQGAPPLIIPTRIAEELISLTARVQAIDVEKRDITLKGPLGNLVTLTVDEGVKRLGEIKVGDHVAVDYYIGIAAELRPPTAEEKAEPLLIFEGKGKALPGITPRGGALRALRVVATVEGIDRLARTATLKGPMGRYLAVRVEDADRLAQLKLGETLVVTCADAVAISLEKVTLKPNATP